MFLRKVDEQVGSLAISAFTLRQDKTKTMLLNVKNLKKNFPASHSFFGKPTSFVHAVQDVSLTVQQGEIVGLVGESGCGKSTLGRLILKLIQPDSGQIEFNDQDITDYTVKQMRPLRREMQIVFQDPYASLNPRLTIGRTLMEPLAIHQIVPRQQRRQRAIELLEKVGLTADSMDKYPHEFSGGQRQRVGIARALSVNPRLIIADEPVSALDVSVQAQIINLLSDLQAEFGLSMIFIAHDLKVVDHLSNRIYVMYLGRVMEELRGGDLSQAQHPYTKSLISAIAVADPTIKKERILLQGDVPSPINPPSGCVFRTRCPLAFEKCAVEVPVLKPSAQDGHNVACHAV